MESMFTNMYTCVENICSSVHTCTCNGAQVTSLVYAATPTTKKCTYTRACTDMPMVQQQLCHEKPLQSIQNLEKLLPIDSKQKH